jgi:peptidoglycan/LPS O-acetylase OafA/YrhL
VACHFEAIGVPAGVREAGSFYPFEGIIAVSFFFILSGFVMAYNYRTWFDGSVGRTKVWNFLVMRGSRLYPVHLLGLVVLVALTGFDGMPPADRLVANLTLTQSFFSDPEWFCTGNPVAWSLSTEFFFYLVFPPLMWCFNKLPRGRGVRPAVVAVLWSGSAAIGWFAAGDYLEVFWLCYVFPPTRSLEFAVGVLAGLMFAERVSKPTRPVTRFDRLGATAWEALIVAAVLACVVYAQDLGLPKGFLFCAYHTPVVVLLILTFARQRGYVSTVLSGRVGIYLGETSYSLYTLHVPIMYYFLTAGWTSAMRGWSTGDKWMLVFAVCLLSAVASYHMVETPARRWLCRRILIRGTATSAVVSGASAPRRAA